MPIRLDETDYLSTSEVAEALQITKQTIKNWLRDKKIPEPKRHPGNAYRLWTPADVDQLRFFLREMRER
jgi:excisionase family DNA binding protein